MFCRCQEQNWHRAREETDPEFYKKLQLVQTADTQKVKQLIIHQKSAEFVSENKLAARQRRNCFQMPFFFVFTEVGFLFFLYGFVTSFDRQKCMNK